MNHLSKVAGLTAIALVSWVGMALAADPKKVPPKLPTTQTPPAPTQMQVLRPDLVPMPWSGVPAIPGFKAWCEGNKLHIVVEVRNKGTAPAGTFKTLVRVNGVVWSVPNNPYTLPWALPPGYGHDFLLTGSVPGSSPIPGKVLVNVQVDSENTVVELNENNNVLTVTTKACK